MLHFKVYFLIKSINFLYTKIVELCIFLCYFIYILLQKKGLISIIGKRKSQNNLLKLFLSLVAILVIGVVGYFNPDIHEQLSNTQSVQSKTVYTSSFELESIPDFSDVPYVVLNNNKPNFEETDFSTESFEKYSDLDALGRCGPAFANLSMDTMPKKDEERESISSIEPSGWINKKYEIVDGGYLYNRCHLIGYQLSAENANEKNLITGTRYMNTEGMLPFENQVANYIKETDNHVLYRVTPIYDGNNLVASGVQIEAQSVEDTGKGICFNVYCYNVQPGIDIDYSTGESRETV